MKNKFFNLYKGPSLSGQLFSYNPFSFLAKTLLAFFLILHLPEKIIAQDDVDYEILSKQDELKRICWPQISTSKTEATTQKMQTDTIPIPAMSFGPSSGSPSGGLSTNRNLISAVEIPNFFPAPDTAEIFDLLGNPLIINGDTIRFFPSSLIPANLPTPQINMHWVIYMSNQFRPDRNAVYLYNVFHRWYEGMPCHYESYGGRQWNSDNSGIANQSDTLFEPHPVFASIIQPPSCYGATNGIIKYNNNPLNYYTFSINGGTAQLSNSFTGLSAGTYTLSIKDSFNNVCDTIITLTQPASTGTSTTVVNCGLFTWPKSGLTYSASGTYFYTSSTTAGTCPSTDTLHLTVEPSSTSTVNITSYNSYTWPANGVTYTSSGNYFSTASTAGCQSNSILNLTIIFSPFNFNLILDQPISCNGSHDGSIQAIAFPATTNYVYILDGGAAINNSGFFQNLGPGTHTVCVSNGTATPAVCKTITLTQPAPLSITILTDSLVSCHGNDGVLKALITGGTTSIQPYQTYWKNSANILLNPTPNNTITTIHNLPSGIYHLTVEDDNGCTLTVNKFLGTALPLNVTATADPVQCNGGSTPIVPTATGGFTPYSYSVNGTPLASSYAAGTYTLTVTDAKGCTATTLVDFGQPASITTLMSASACNSYYWSMNATTYTASGFYVAILTTISGCNTINVLDLTINSNTTTTTNVTACNSYYWPVSNITYTVSGSYTKTSLNTSGCVQTSILNLTINHSSTSSSNAMACNSFNWSVTGASNPYTATGTYTATHLNTTGCVHTDTLHLIINHSSTFASTVVACNSYNWTVPGATNPYNVSGNYTATHLNASGCVHTDTLHLTINQNTTSSTTITACNSYIWNVAGATNPYTVSGNYTATHLNASACVHTDTLHLTINQSTTSSTTITACNSYIWNVAGATNPYTVSGNYTATHINANGCVHTDTLHLTINQSTTSSTTITACNTYTWNVAGATNPYTVSGNYTATHINANGCVHTDTLHLTINQNTTSSNTITACNTYTWNVAGATNPYTVSGNYTATHLNATGCLHTDTLHLIINQSSVVTTYATACDAYTWTVTGASNPYTVSGMYTITSLNSSGCVNTAVLNLTIKHSSNSTSNVTASNAYQWPVNNVTYTMSGMYTATVPNAVGCDSILTLNLTINLVPSVLNIRCFIQGYMQSSQLMKPVLANQGQPTTTNACDTIKVELHNSNPPYQTLYQAKVVLSRDGFATANFPPLAGNFYIAVKHRNAIETWSNNPVFISAQTVNYNFTNGINKAFGNNQVLVSPGVWGFYSGDVNNDDNIDLVDIGQIETGLLNFDFGYLPTDVNGDGSVDLLDAPVVETNLLNYIYSEHP